MGWALRQSSSPLAVGTCLVDKEKQNWGDLGIAVTTSLDIWASLGTRDGV